MIGAGSHGYYGPNPGCITYPRLNITYSDREQMIGAGSDGY